jgi:hypothetical protein
MPQTSYSQNAIVAQPGMAYDMEQSNRDVVSVICNQNIPFGVLCELDSNGLLQPVQDSGTAGSFLPALAGISMFDPLGVEQSYVQFAVPASGTGSSAVGWKTGMSVPVMRKGRIWVLGDASGVATRTGNINVWHSSDGSSPQGTFTFRAVQSTLHAEIDIAPDCTVWDPTLQSGTVTDPFGNVFKIYAVEINA